jgi:predicted metal-dependent HD superfamily phosphohydrolase
MLEKGWLIPALFFYFAFSTMLSVRYQKIKHYWLNKLNVELPSYLSYHGVEHTRDVINACSYLAEKEGVSEHDKELLLVAALFHDSGFLNQYKSNEPIGARFAEEILPDFGYNIQEIEEISEIIVSTTTSVEPQGILQEIMHDADLNYLGRPGYFNRVNSLRHERTIIGQTYSDLEWLDLQEKFLSKFRFVTDSAILLLADGLSKNLELVQKHLTEIKA